MARKPLPYYPFYVDAFDEGVLSMNLAEVGLYILSLGHSWKHGSIPDDPAELARLIRRKPSEVRKAWPAVRPKWEETVSGRLVNHRQEKERVKAIDKSDKASDAAFKKHASAPANAHASAYPSAPPNAHADGVPRASESCSNSQSVSGSSEKKTKPEVSPAETAVIVTNSGVQAVFQELKSIYQQAGKPIAEKHENLAFQLLMSIPEERLGRVANYVKWALVSGTWSDVAHTKSLLNLLRDGDWDVELTARSLPQVAENRVKKSQDEARRQFIEGV